MSIICFPICIDTGEFEKHKISAAGECKMQKDLERYVNLVQSYVKDNYKKCFREPHGKFVYPCFVPGSSYSDQLWDWDSWLTDIALAAAADCDDITVYEQGCVLNFLAAVDKEGRIPINIIADRESIFDLKPNTQVNIHKPCLAQHALFVTEKSGNDAGWLKEKFPVLKGFIEWYKENCFHEETGLYYWLNDFAMPVKNNTNPAKTPIFPRFMPNSP